MRQLEAQLTHEIHLAEMGQADIANMQSIFNILMQSDTDVERTYMEIAADLGGTGETRAAALEWKQIMIERISLQKQEVWNAINAMKSGGYDEDATSQLQQMLNQRTNPPPPPPA